MGTHRGRQDTGEPTEQSLLEGHVVDPRQRGRDAAALPSWLPVTDRVLWGVPRQPVARPLTRTGAVTRTLTRTGAVTRTLTRTGAVTRALTSGVTRALTRGVTRT